MFARVFSLIFLFLILFPSLRAQERDTVQLNENVEELHSPHKATIKSVILPGLGQIYNKKYWKVPIIYAGIGATMYMAFEERKKFREFKEAYVLRVDDDPTTVDNKYANYSDQNMLSLIDYHRRSRDLFFIFSGIIYALNVVDATVDAHLYYFDVSEDISASIFPNIEVDNFNMAFSPGLKLKFEFGKNPLSYHRHH